MVRDAILNINTYFVTYVVVIGFGSSVVRREFRNPQVPGSNHATTIKSFFFFSFFFLFHIIKLLTKQNNSNTIHNFFFFF